MQKRPGSLDIQINQGKTLTITTDNLSFKELVKEEFLPSELRKPKRVDVKVEESGGSSIDQSSKLFLPFDIISSSVSTGYQSGLTVSVAFTRLHEDKYGDGLDSPMQGPFTEKFVGGHPSRHTELNSSGSDNSANRAERFRILGTSNFTFTRDGLSFPAHMFYRDGMAKRPLNIANIKYTSASLNQIGNFQHNYQIVQTGGRTNNNFWFRSVGALSSSVQESNAVSGVIDFALPNRSTQKTVIVERFSAPGEAATMSRGYLDTVAEEFSVYNQLNYRNLTVRQPLQTLLTRHCGQFGIDSVNGSPNASFHKVNRNTLTRIEWSGSSDKHSVGTIVSASVRDNWYVQHQIPRSDRQYAWITASLKSWSPNGITSVY
jgi:hypothetical protein